MNLILGPFTRKLIEFAKPFVLVVLFLGVFRSAVADWNDVPTGSMKPTILEGDRIVVNKVAYDLQLPFTQHRIAELGAPARGDIIVFFSPEDGTRLVKRVIGVAGDRIELQKNRILVNGEPARYETPPDESLSQLEPVDQVGHRFAIETIDDHPHAIMLSALRDTGKSSFGPVTVPEDHVFVLGDNRDNSHDSRWFGFVPRSRIDGRATSVALSVNPDHHYFPRWERFLSRLR